MREQIWGKNHKKYIFRNPIREGSFSGKKYCIFNFCYDNGTNFLKTQFFERNSDDIVLCDVRTINDLENTIKRDDNIKLIVCLYELCWDLKRCDEKYHPDTGKYIKGQEYYWYKLTFRIHQVEVTSMKIPQIPQQMYMFSNSSHTTSSHVNGNSETDTVTNSNLNITTSNTTNNVHTTTSDMNANANSEINTTSNSCHNAIISNIDNESNVHTNDVRITSNNESTCTHTNDDYQHHAPSPIIVNDDLPEYYNYAPPPYEPYDNQSTNADNYDPI